MADTWTWSCGTCGTQQDGVPFRDLSAVNDAHHCGQTPTPAATQTWWTRLTRRLRGGDE